MLDKLKNMSKEELQLLLVKLLSEDDKSSEKENKKSKNNRQVKFEENKFVDDGTLCQEDKNFTKEVKFSVSERRKIDQNKRTCDKCKKEFYGLSSDKECNDCILAKGKI